MRFPWQGLHVLEASASSAGVCHRCVTHLPGARVAERSDALGAVEIGRHRGMRRSEDARAQPRPTGRPLGRSDGGKQGAGRVAGAGGTGAAYPVNLCDHSHG